MGLEIDTGYIVPFGAMKIVEIGCLLISWATLADVAAGTTTSGRYAFCMAMCILAWLFAIAWFVMNLLGIFKKLNVPSKHIVFGVIHIFGGVLILISGALLANLYSSCNWSFCNIVRTGAAFAIISAIIFIADGVFHVVLKDRLPSGGGDTSNPTA